MPQIALGVARVAAMAGGRAAAAGAAESAGGAAASSGARAFGAQALRTVGTQTAVSSVSGSGTEPNPATAEPAMSNGGGGKVRRTVAGVAAAGAVLNQRQFDSIDTSGTGLH